MEANVKLLKKKRIAHMCGKMPKSNFDEPKLPPDDFVYNIMKDMDSKNVISYQQSQEVRSKKIQSLSCNEGERQMNSTTQDGYYNKQAKKVLPKRSFPLMKKCQTSIKYLKKNRCIPKPRAHVGFVPKPQVKPACYTEPKSSISENQNSSKVVKAKKVQSKAYSKILQSNYIQNKISKPNTCENNQSASFAAEDEVACHLSSTDDDDVAFENFVQKAIEENNDSTDSDSRLIIHRKKSRNKSKQKKKKHRSISFSDDENNKHISKITSIPLSDSSENESKDTYEEHTQSLKRKTDSLQGVQKRVCKEDSFESYNSESLSDPPSDNYNNYSSSDEDFSVPALTQNNETITASDVNLDVSNANTESYQTLSNHVTEHQLDHNPSSEPILNNIESEATIDSVNTDTSESNGLLSCYSEITKNVPKYKLPCYVHLARDPILDKEALTFCSTSASSEGDCILLSEDSDVDEMSTSHSISSPALEKTCAPLTLSPDAQKGEEIQNSTNIRLCEDAEIDDCVIMCEVPKVVLKDNIKESDGKSKLLSSESLSSTAISTSTHSNIQNLQTITGADEFENTKPDTVHNFSEINNEQLLNSDKNVDSVSLYQEDESKSVDEFNVQIVAVKSLVESSPNAVELDEIEIIDLSDDDEQENSEVVKKIDINDHSEISVQDGKAIEPSLTEINPPEHNNQNYNSMIKLSEHQIQSSCENSTAKEPNLPDPKILEILSRINFDCIKEVINRTKVVDTIGKSSEVEVISDKLPTLPGPTKINENKVEETFSTNIEAFEKRSLNFGKTALVTDMNIKSTSNNSCIKENISSETSFQSKTFQLVNAENGIVHNSDQENKALNLKQNPENSLYNYTKTNVVYSDTNTCNNSKTTETSANSVPNKERQLISQTPTETVPCQTKISKEMDASVPNTALKHKYIAAAKYEKDNIKETIKCEIPESPSDDLDATTSTLIQDLNPPNTKVLSLLNLYKTEYTRYMQIKNAEVNLSAGLKLLHDSQVTKLVHLRSSIKNLVKHDACFYKVAKENSLEAKASIVKHEIKSKVEVKSFSSPADSSKELEDTKHFETEKKQSLNIDSAGTSREKLIRLMMNTKCAECGKPATARCQGCTEMYYCSPNCGELSWKQGHYAVCKR